MIKLLPKRCDKCNKISTETFIYYLKLNLRLCLKCNSYRNKLIKMNKRYGLFNYLKRRELGIKDYIKKMN